MAWAIPTATNLHLTTHSADSRSRGVTGSPSVGASKIAGNLPITTNSGQFINNTSSSPTGALDTYHYSLLPSGSHDVSTNSKVVIWTWQFNAPNRIQCASLANDGIVGVIGSGSGSPPSNRKTYQIGGFDTPAGKSQGGPICYVIDLNDTSQESTTGTFDNTDVETYGFGMVRFDLSGTSTPIAFPSRCWVFDCEIDGSRPEFTGTGGDWDGLVDAIQGTDYTDKIGDDWVKKIGKTTVFLASPWQIGDGTDVTTFNDNGYTIIGPSHDDPSDPRFRLTHEGVQGGVRLPNNAGAVVTLSGSYLFPDANGPNVDFDVSNASTINLDGSTWIGRGGTKNNILGSSVSGAATWDRCGTVDATAEPDVDGSTFRAPTDDALLIDSAQTLSDLTFSNYTGQVGLRINGGAGSFTVTLDNVQFDKTGTFEVENSGSGTITLALTNGSTSLGAGDVTNTGGGSIVISNPVTTTITILDGRDNSDLQNARVILKASDGTGDLPYQDSVTITRVTTTATVSHTAHGLSNGEKVEIKGAVQPEYNGAKTISNVSTNAYDYTVSGSPTSPATGTITATGIVLEGLTDVNGEISSSRTWGGAQPVTGVARKATTSPIFKDGPLTGIISATAGLTITQALIFDE